MAFMNLILRDQLASDILSQFSATEAAKKSLTQKDSASIFLDKLQSQKLWSDALHMLAFLLPIDEAMRWACLCVQTMHQTLEYQLNDEERHVWQFCQIWLSKERQHKNEDLYQQAFSIAEKVGLENPMAYLAIAVFWGKALLQEGDFSINNERLYRQAIAAVVIILSMQHPEQASNFYQLCVEKACSLHTNISLN